MDTLFKPVSREIRALKSIPGAVFDGVLKSMLLVLATIVGWQPK